MPITAPSLQLVASEFHSLLACRSRGLASAAVTRANETCLSAGCRSAPLVLGRRAEDSLWPTLADTVRPVPMGRVCCVPANSSSAAAVLHAPRCHPWHSGFPQVAAKSGAPITPVKAASGAATATTDVLTTEAAKHFKPGAGTAVGDAHSPWAVGWQMRERNILWNDELKLRVVKHIASQELGIEDEELDSRLQTLCILVPDYASRLSKGSPQQLALLARNTHLIGQRLLRLREILPQADISYLVSSRLSLLLEEDLDVIAGSVARLRVLLPQVLVDKFVEAHPQVLDVQDFERAIEDAELMMPQLDLTKTLRNNPHLVLGLQKGRHLIPYELPNV
eukprot:GHUV01007617.1.p1 GENE.GHUV01007617.1~~GHUV01007617.1.p1  ORF type:complete len:336 (+),score=49.15 GHUV01007617.1:280-1287(+)